MMTPTRHILQIILFISALSTGLQSCFKRELEHEENYINIKQDPSIADNEVLRFRTFKLDDYDRYIIFGNNNEVSIDGTAQLPLLLYYDGQNRSATIDLGGCIYEYQTQLDTLSFRGALLRSPIFTEPIVIDAETLLKRQGSTSQSQDRFILRLKAFTLPDGKRVSVDERQSYLDKPLGISIEPLYHLTYYRN